MKRKWIYILSACLLLAFLIIPFLFAGTDKSFVFLSRNPAGPVFYAVMLAFSVVILIGYVIFARKKYVWLLLSFVSVCIVNTGYLALSMAGNVSEALLANRISYFGNVYMLLFLNITLANACGVRYSRSFIGLLLSISTIMFFFASTQGYLDLFYRNVDFAIIDGYARILKDYGPMHTVYVFYIFLYLLLIVGTMIYSVRKKLAHSLSYCVLIAWIGLVNVAVWFVEQFIPHYIEFLSLSYVLNAALLLWIYRQLVRDGSLDSYIVTMKIRTDGEAEKTMDIVMENRNRDEMLSQEQTMELERMSPQELRRIIDRLPAESRLTDRETEVAVLLLSNLKRKEMAASLCVSEDTIKTHTSHIYGKLKVTSRRSLQEKAEEMARWE